MTIDGKHYVDGGMRSTANVDLATGADVVVVIAPLPQAFSKATSIRAQLAATGATRTAVVTPDEKALVDIGKNVLDPAKRADAARTGLRQAADVVDKVRKAWRLRDVIRTRRMAPLRMTSPGWAGSFSRPALTPTTTSAPAAITTTSTQ